MMENKRLQRLIKRCFDIFFSILLLIFSAPVLLIAMLIIKINSPRGSVIFKQTRVGLKGKLFTIYKLRTMTNRCDKYGKLLPDQRRLKGWGKLIRRTNIDEIPQVINILKGDMSLIGPRPVLPCDVEKFNKYQMKRQDVLPGISGWEAVNEWKVTDWDKKFEYDIYYVEHFSLWLDIKIFFKTIKIIFLNQRPGEDYRPGRFEGNQENDKKTN